MTPQELKNSILQMAIQGKLVEQRAEEGTADELIHKIQTEKAELIRQEKIKKEMTLSVISEDEVPFEIPETWKWVYLMDLCSIVTGKRDANFGSEKGQYLFFTCAKDPIKCDSYSFEGEAILLAGNGDISNISHYNGKFEAYQRTYVVQTPFSCLFLPYLFYHISSNWVVYNTNKMYGTAIPYIRLGNLQAYPIALPPLAEQKRIVAKIESLLPLIDRYEKAWTRLEEFNKRFPGDMQKSLFQMAIQGKLVEQRPEEGTGEELYRQIQQEKAKLVKAGKIKKEKPLPEIAEDEVPFEVPETWKWVRLGNLVPIQRGASPRPKGSPDYWANERTPYHWIKISDMSKYSRNDTLFNTDEYLTELGTTYSVHVDENYLITAASGSLGKIAKLGISGYIYDGLMCMNFSGIDLDKDYVIALIKTMVEYLMSISTGTAWKNITTDILKNLLVPLPPLPEQHRIVAQLEKLLPLCERLK